MARDRKRKNHPTEASPAAKTTMASSSTAVGDTNTIVEEKESGPLFFYGHKSPPHDFLSQHFLCTFTHVPLTSQSPSRPSSSSPPETITITFTSTEQWMMYSKALLFSDPDIASLVLEASKPLEQKRLGRQVKGFTEEKWRAHRERIVEEGNWLKFSQNEDLKKRLLQTEERELVETNPRDRIWGVGFGKAGAEANRARWGLNLLGKALMRVRERMREEQAVEKR